MILWLLACTVAPYPDYFPDGALYPQITGTTPEFIESRLAGAEIIIEGKHLAGTRTVVVGGRNADIVSVDDRAIAVRLPALPAGSSSLAISVATGEGVGTLEGALQVDIGHGRWSDAEQASVALVQLDCPVTVWGKFVGGSWYPYEWCGPSAGWASAEGFIGSAEQPGLAGELSGVATLAQLPAMGDVVVFGPGDARPPSAPLVHGSHTGRERIYVQTERDFARDLDLVQSREALFFETYAWVGDVIESLGPTAVLYDDESCWISDIAVVDGEADALLLAEDAGGATGLQLGFQVLEDYYGEVWTVDGLSTTTSLLDTEHELVFGSRSGVALAFDEWSGWFFAEGVGGELGIGELPSQAEYQVSRTDADGEKVEQGWVDSGESIELISPDLMSGDVGIKRHQDLLISWTPAEYTEEPDFLLIELVVFDTSVDDPTWQTEVARLVARGDDAVGALTLPADILADLPAAPNNWRPDGSQTGYWAELTIARHRLRQVDKGRTVVDFVHAVNGPVRLR